MQMKQGGTERSESGKGNRLIIHPSFPVPPLLLRRGQSHTVEAPSPPHAGLHVIRCSVQGWAGIDDHITAGVVPGGGSEQSWGFDGRVKSTLSTFLHVMKKHLVSWQAAFHETLTHKIKSFH